VADRLFVHIGMPKSGTTYLQTLLWSNKSRLADHGVLVPGSVRYDHNRIAQAVRLKRPDANALRAWARTVDEVHEWPGTAVLSNEWFCGATQAQARRTIEAFWPSEVHVVATARDLVRTVPSAWQETVKLGLGEPFETFVDSLADRSARWSWVNLDPSLCLPRWQASLPRGNVHLVTVPTGGGRPELLWERVASVVGLPDHGLDLTSTLANEAISAESMRLLLLAGTRLRAAVDVDNVAWNEPYTWIRHVLSHQVLAPLGGHPIGMSDVEADRIRSRSLDAVRRLRTSGYDVVGDLDDLVSAKLPGTAMQPDEVPDPDVLDVSVEAIAELLVRLRAETRRADAAAKRLAELEPRRRRPVGRRGSPQGR
jgi:hypothetical protein